MTTAFMLGEDQQRLLSAALRHLRDAEHLSSAAPADRSLDQAYHLAGFAPECARKATLPSTFHVAIGHGVLGPSETAVRLALSHDPVAHRYDVTEWSARYGALATWSESSRYEATGTRDEAEVVALVAEARRIVEDITLALWADGRIGATFPW